MIAKVVVISCIDNLVHSWDEAAILQFGSLEGLGGSDEGNHGDCFKKKHCQNIKTCGQSGDFDYSQFHIIPKLAMIYCPKNLSESFAERIFSAGKLLLNNKSNRMKNETFNMRVCMRMNKIFFHMARKDPLIVQMAKECFDKIDMNSAANEQEVRMEEVEMESAANVEELDENEQKTE